MLILNYISIETVVMSIVLLLCICIIGIAVFIRQQIISQKQVHKNCMQEFHVQIRAQQLVFQNKIVLDVEYIKWQKALVYKMDAIKVKCLYLNQLTKYLNN